jgi:hypothetical protein
MERVLKETVVAQVKANSASPPLSSNYRRNPKNPSLDKRFSESYCSQDHIFKTYPPKDHFNNSSLLLSLQNDLFQKKCCVHFQLLQSLRGCGRATAKWLVAGSPPRRPWFASGQSMWSLWWTKWQWGRFSLSTSVSPANHSTDFSIIIYPRVWHNRLIGGRSAEWTQLDSTPDYSN